MAYTWGAAGATTGAGTKSAREGKSIEAFYLRDEKGQYVAQELHGVKTNITATVIDSGQTFTLGATLGSGKIISATKVFSNTDWTVWEITAEGFEADPVV